MILYIQLAASFIVGGLVIALQTLLAERVPQKWSGIALTIPTTMGMGLFFIAITKSVADIPEVALIMPAGIIPSYTFVLIFSYLVRYGLWRALLPTYLVWGALSYTLISFPPTSYFESTFIYCLPLILILYLLTKKPKKSIKLKSFPINKKHVLMRALIGGTIIFLATLLAKIAGNHWGGLFALFPAAFSSTFIIYYYLQGPEVIPQVVRSIFWPGPIGFIIFGYIASITFPEYGIWIGLLSSYAGALLFFWLWVQLKHRQT